MIHDGTIQISKTLWLAVEQACREKSGGLTIWITTNAIKRFSIKKPLRSCFGETSNNPFTGNRLVLVMGTEHYSRVFLSDLS